MRHPYYLYAVLMGAAASLAPLPLSPQPFPTNESSAAVPVAAPANSALVASVRENLTPFDPLSVELFYRDHHWQLVAGDRVLKDFGRRESEGRQALRLIRELNLTQQGTVGQPRPVLEYWLSGGQAPEGALTGVRILPLDRANLHVEQMQGQWCLRERQRVLFNFGLHREEAEQALAIIRKYAFCRLALVGQAVPSMTIFLADSSHPSMSAAPSAPPAPRLAESAHSQAGPMSPFPAVGPIVPPAVPPLQGTHHRGPRQPLGRGGIELTAHHGTKAAPPAGNPPGMEDQQECIPVDWRGAQIRQEEDGWKLLAGGYVLAQLGDSEEDARLALRAIRYYRFSELYRLGRPVPYFSYLLCNGQAPHGLMFGLQSQAFDPETVSLLQIGPSWAVCSGNRVLIELGSQKEEGQQLLELIGRQKVDRLASIGPPEGRLTLLLRSR